jgi:transcriptional regulator with PAS, ATPase and Fis domain
MTMKHLKETSRTFISSSAPAEVLVAARGWAERAPLISLTIHHPGGTELRRLEPGAPVTVGRRSPADIAIPDPALSRTHARFEVTPDGRVTVEDLGSTNGTWLRGERIGTVEMRPGDEVVLGGAMASVHFFGSTLDRTSASLPAVAPIAVSPSMRAALEMAERLGGEILPVILQGETGTGKEVVAHFIHHSGPRKGKPMVCVNCAAIPGALVESTLFGHQRGAFTGAAAQQKGVFEAADGGSLFLDEIGELPLPAQAALLRVIETKRVARVGSTQEIAVDVRIIAATHRDLEAMSEAGTFRSDLYYRLSAMVLNIPPLRERTEDIEPLVRFYLAREGRARVSEIAPDALRLLRAYRWPGNVRELRNAVERALVVARGRSITEADLPAKIQGSNTPPAGIAAPLGGDDAPVSTPPAMAAGDLKLKLQEYESRLLVDTLLSTGWNQTEAAKLLGMPIRTLAYKIKSFGITRPGR